MGGRCEDGSLICDLRFQIADLRWSAIGHRKSAIRHPKSDIPNPKSDIPNPKSDIPNPMSLWIESAYQTTSTAGRPGDIVRTFQTEEQFVALVASQIGSVEQGAAQMVNDRPSVDLIATQALSRLAQAHPFESVVEDLLAALPAGQHTPIAIVQIRAGSQAWIAECDAPPLFIVRQGHFLLLPVIEEERYGRLVRRCEFAVQDGDYLAMVSEGYLRAIGWGRRWGWRDVAVSIRRLIETRCDAEQLLAALTRLASQRVSGSVIPDTQYPISVLAMSVRPMRTATVWSGPPANRAVEPKVLEKLMAEPGMRIICGGTTAEIAVRLLSAQLIIELRPDDGWTEVPPVSRLVRQGSEPTVDLVTEGAVTLGKARERIASVQRVRDLPRKDDGATRLARLLLTADKIRFLIGTAVNPAQRTPDGASWRCIAIDELIDDLRARGKIVIAEHF